VAEGVSTTPQVMALAQAGALTSQVRHGFIRVMRIILVISTNFTGKR
jgi:hypothetical protein